MEGVDIDVPKYFICPISLQIMKDPVTAITGITYDRESIEHWLFTSTNTICPVTKQPLPRDSDLTPNHNLRRLIQAWCSENASLGVDRIPTPKPSLDKSYVVKLLKDLSLPDSQMKALRKLDLLAAENERNWKYMVDAAVPEAMLSFTMSCFKQRRVEGLEEALSILRFLRTPLAETNSILAEHDQILESLIWVLGCEFKNHVMVKSHAALVLKTMIAAARSNYKSNILERLKPDFFERIVGILKETSVTQQGINAALQVLLDACSCGKNRVMMVQAEAVSVLIGLELRTPEKRTTELIMGVLFHLCSFADGRAQFLSHRGGVAVVAKRILRVSSVVDDRAVLILSLICKYSGTNIVLEEMLEVGAVGKLCLLLQSHCPPYLKDKAKEVLRSNYDGWKNSPCIDEALLTRFFR